MGNKWGVDLGGTKIEAVVLDSAGGVVIRQRIDTEAERGYTHIVDRIAQLISEISRRIGEEPPERIGFGTPGTVDPPTGVMKNCNTVCLNGQPLSNDLQMTLKREVVVANDANCFALAEATLGAARGFATVFGVIMGTGVGGGLVVEGKVLGGAQGIAGEWGHNVLEMDGEPCYCGKRGCVETVLSGTGLRKFYERRTGQKRKLEEIVADTADPDARATVERLHEKFGEALSVVVNVFDPHAIVLGGGVGNIASLLVDGRANLERWVFNNRLDTVLIRPSLGDSAGVFGAAWLT